MRGLRMPSADAAVNDICSLLHIESTGLDLLSRYIDRIVEKSSSSKQPEKSSTSSSSSSQCSDSGYDSPKYGQPETPTEVENVYF